MAISCSSQQQTKSACPSERGLSAVLCSLSSASFISEVITFLSFFPLLELTQNPSGNFEESHLSYLPKSLHPACTFQQGLCCFTDSKSPFAVIMLESKSYERYPALAWSAQILFVYSLLPPRTRLSLWPKHRRPLVRPSARPLCRPTF